MVAPATSDRVVAVGAATDGELADYSSLSANGSVDLIAPGGAGGRATEDLAGTSAAAPYVAGTAALMQSGGNDPAPARVEAILERTADGEDDALDAVEAVEAVEAATTSTDGASDSVGDADASGDDATGESAADWDRNATRTGEDDGVRPAEREGDGRSDSDDDAGTDRNDEGDGTRTDEQDDDGDRDRSDGQRDRAGDGDSATAGSEERESDERRGS
jgi:subtilisin family serine protease